MSDTDWKAWQTSKDIPSDLRHSIAQSATSPLMSREERDSIKKVILGTLDEAVNLVTENYRLNALCTVVSQTYPNLPLQAVFKAVSLETGIPVSRLRKLWFEAFSKDV